MFTELKEFNLIDNKSFFSPAYVDHVLEVTPEGSEDDPVLPPGRRRLLVRISHLGIFTEQVWSDVRVGVLPQQDAGVWKSQKNTII